MLPLAATLVLLTVSDAPFPFSVSRATPARVELAPDVDAVERLGGLVEVRLRDVPWPGGAAVDLRLRRETVPVSAEALHLDGRATGIAPGDGQSHWTGAVVGEARSEVFLALSPRGAWGWIDVGDDRVHLVTERTPGGSLAALVTDDWARAHRSSPPLRCGNESMDHAPPPVAHAGGGGGSLDVGASQAVLKVRLALETDWHFFSLFGSELATADYCVAILGAANSRYREQVDVVMQLEYLGLHSNPIDGWTQTDQGGDCFAVLAEFMTKWAPGSAPVTADLYHYFTGANTFCGIASGDLCDAGGAYSVTGKMDGLSPFPPAPGPLNWDFVWFCHETGHNFGSPHTHAFCPPLDECAPSGWFGPCQTQQLCTTTGTFMSYCHACPGGMSNFTTWFHPGVVPVLRATAESGCLAPFEGVLTQDLGFGLAGANGVPALVVSYEDGPDLLRFRVVDGPPAQSGAFIASTATLYQTFLGVGTLVPAPTFVISTTTGPNGRAALDVPIQASAPAGITLYTQAWFLDPAGPSGYAASNAVEWELIRP